MKRVVVIGIGNIILGDEGVGVHVLNRLRLEKLPDEVELIEGGVGGIALLNFIKGVERALFIDAVAGAKPGRIHRLTQNDLEEKVKTSLHPMSLHDIGLAEMIKIGKTLYPDEMPREIVIYGIEITELKAYSTELSKGVNNSIDRVVKLIVDELKDRSRRK
ncbi:MAG: hydrogenase maturation protease [Promethearchaeati archaeon SRVP18_Atabeyarchaeia-1]